MDAAFITPDTFNAELATAPGSVGSEWYVVVSGLDVGVFQFLFVLFLNLDWIFTNSIYLVIKLGVLCTK